MVGRGWNNLAEVALVFLAGFVISSAYDVRRYHRGDVPAIGSEQQHRGNVVFYEPARKLTISSPAGSPHSRLTPFDVSGHRKPTPVVTRSGPSRVRPTVIKKTLRNENGVLHYRPDGYPTRKATRRNRKRKRGRHGNVATTKSSRRPTSRSKTRRKNRLKNRRTRKYRPTHKTNRVPTSRRTYVSSITGKGKHNRPVTTYPSHTRRVTETTKTPTLRTTKVYPSSKTPQKFNKVFEVTTGRQTNSRLSNARNNPYGLIAPPGFRLTTASVPDQTRPQDQPTRRHTPKPRTSGNFAGTTALGTKKSRPTNPSSILQVQTTSVDDAYMMLRDIGAGFRVKLVPTAAIKSKEFNTVAVDEFDILPDRNVSEKGSSDKRDTAISALKALFRKLSNATDFQPRRREAAIKLDRTVSRPVLTNGSWWEREHVCITETPGLYGVPSSILGRLKVVTKCSEDVDVYECIESYGAGENSPKKTTSYRCCQGFQKSPGKRRCEPVRLLLEHGAERDIVAGFSTEDDLPPDSGYDQSQEHTIFMPSDEVVAAFLEESQLDTSDENSVEMFLENHVIVGKSLPSSDMENNQVLTALSENSIRINFYDKRKLMMANCRQVMQRDVESGGNAVVHYISGIIREVSGTLYDYIAKNHHLFSMFKAVVDSSGMASVLQSVNASTSLFLPTDEAFEMTSGIPDSPDCLVDVVKNHLLDGILCSLSWANSTLKSQAGEDLVMRTLKERFLVNGVIVTERDIMTRNGVIHVIDGLLQPLKAQSVLTLMSDDPENSKMLEYLELGGMKNVLTTGENFTLIVPKTSAFKNLPAVVTNRLRKKPYQLQRFLLHSTIPYEVGDSQLLSAELLNTLDPAGHLRVTSYHVSVPLPRGDKVFIGKRKVAAIQCSRVSKVKPKRACNGAIIQIDKVLVPPTGSALSILRHAPKGNFSILLRAIARVKLGQVLAKSEEITFFAPTNDAFERLPARFVKFLFQNSRALLKLLRFHITKGFHCCDYMAQAYARLPTLLGPTVTSCPKKDRILLGRSQKRLRAEVVKCEIMAKNGMIHAIDNVLIPSGLRD